MPFIPMMQRLPYFVAWLCCLLSCALSAVIAEPIDEVDPFIGVDGGGNVFPGACLPFSLMRLSPDTLPPQPTSGYSTDQPIIGFSHTHTSGTGGGGRYGNLLVTPVIGDFDPAQMKFDRQDERASPGYYAVTLMPSKVRCELTVSPRCGVHRYTFPKSDAARIVFNVSATRVTRPDKPTASAICLESNATVVSDRRIEGFVKVKGGWGQDAPHTTWFVAEFDRPIEKVEAWRDGKVVDDGSKEVSGTNAGFVFRFNTQQSQTIGLRVGISLTGLQNAGKELSATQGKNFDQLRDAAADTWRKRLGAIEIEGGTPEQRKCFYTALYRSVIMPTDITGGNPRWTNDEPHFWDFYAIWDTFRCVNSLYTLIYPDDHARMIRCLIDIYKHEGWLPDAWVVGHLSQMQGGTNADMVIGEAIIKNLPGFDRKAAYEAIRKDGSDRTGNGGSFGRYPQYFSLGYVPATSATEMNKLINPTSRTLEYAANDFTIGLAAKALGRDDDARFFEKQSRNAFNLFNPETKFFWAKDVDGKWIDGFDPAQHNRPGNGPYYEGSAWQYAFFAPHDMQGLIDRHGGAAKFEEFIDRFFDTGQYSATNEPDILAPWLYTYINRPAKNVDRVRAILQKHYNTSRKGLPGNDDSGTLSTWYLFASMGFYPVAGQDVYLMSSPRFPKITIHLGNGKTLVIASKNLSNENRYIQSAKLNGTEWDKGWFVHGDIADGGELQLEMGPQPSLWGTQTTPPPSSSRP